jgi:F-type H+-transporting ATPase subunit b
MSTFWSPSAVRLGRVSPRGEATSNYVPMSIVFRALLLAGIAAWAAGPATAQESPRPPAASGEPGYKSLTLERAGKDQFTLSIRYVNDKGPIEKQFKGTLEELHSDVENETGFSASERERVLADLGKVFEESGVPLGFKSDLALWSGVTFVIFVALLGRFAWRPLIAALDKREARIRDDIAAAEAAREKAEQMLAEHAKTLASVQDEVRGILAEGRRDAELAKQAIIGEAHKEAEAAKERALHEIGRARDAALKDLFDVMASQVAEATEHVLGHSVTGADQDRLIDEALAQFPRR